LSPTSLFNNPPHGRRKFQKRVALTNLYMYGGRRGRDRMVVGFTTTCAISAYHHLSCEVEPRS